MAFSSLYTGATGLNAYSTALQVVGNNLANVSTTGYKKAETLFSDLISQYLSTGNAVMPSGANATSQVGMGVTVGDVGTCFLQGGMQSTNEATDLAISGAGFFGVRSEDDNVTYYTRNGVFRFDEDGFLRDTGGNYVQGYEVDRDTGALGGIGDIQLPWEEMVIDGETKLVAVSDPKATSLVEIATNLDHTALDQHSDPDNPLFSLIGLYDGAADDPMSGFSGYTTSITIYDSDGGAHDLNVYFDRVDSDTLSNSVNGYSYWEYLVAIDPAEDGSGLAGTSGAGLLSMGTLTFNNDGQMVNASAYALGAGGADPSVLSNWGATSFDANGVPTLNIVFADTGDDQPVAVSFGLYSETGSWANTPASGAGLTAASVGTDVRALAQMDETALEPFASTSGYDLGSTTLYQSQDGYTRGYLSSVSVDADGYVVGSFTNGQSENLYCLTVYRFNSEDGLAREGSNLFAATEDSGDALAGVAQDGGRGEISSGTLEASNVDMADEFVDLILFQRGMQANTKVVSTSDSILNTTISMKH